MTVLWNIAMTPCIHLQLPGIQRMADEQHHRIVTIGGSAGSLEVLIDIVKGLPQTFPASIFVVQHISPEALGHLAEILQHAGDLPAHTATDGTMFAPGHIYVAPPDHHLLIDEEKILLSRGPRENRTRPAIDPLFRAAAVAHGPRVIALLLSGMLDDGTAGLRAVKRCGGITVIQDPKDAAFPDMPRSAHDNVDIDYCAPGIELASILSRIISEPTRQPVTPPEDLRLGVEISRYGSRGIKGEDSLGERAALSCPECGGPLWEMHQHSPLRYRCQVGHGFTARSLLASQDTEVERALWEAVRTLEERSRLVEKLAADAAAKGYERTSTSYSKRARESQNHADQLRRLLFGLNHP
jgi:two-component system chemotaxis response regulator CheB